MNTNAFLFGIVLFTIVACATPGDTSQQAQQAPASTETTREFPPTLAKAFEAHGGIDAWDQMQALEYDIVKEEGNEHQLIDLKSRKVLLTTADWTIGFNGEEVWVTPDSAALGRRNARFYHNLVFYFFALPYVAGDPGVNYEDLGPAEVRGQSLDRILLTYNAGVGDAPEDKYILYFDNQGILKLINYSVTYYDASRADRFNAIMFDDWTEVNGLLLPKTHIGYRWEGDSLGAERYVRRFDNLKISPEAPDASLFAMPEGAYISPR